MMGSDEGPVLSDDLEPVEVSVEERPDPRVKPAGWTPGDGFELVAGSDDKWLKLATGRIFAGTFLRASAPAFRKGRSGNPAGRKKGSFTSISEVSRSLATKRVSEFAWSRKVAAKLGFGVREMNAMRISELVCHATKFNACTGKAGYLTEDNNRIEGKVPDRVEHGVQGGVVIALFASEPPENWYKDVRGLIGHQPGDPLLPGETTEDFDGYSTVGATEGSASGAGASSSPS